jgi:hypothetical protein
LLQDIDDPQSVPVVFEGTAENAHLPIQFPFGDVSKGRMAEIVRQSEGLDVFFVELKCNSRGAGDLRNLDGMSEAISEMIAKASGEDLSFPFQPAEGAGMDNAVAVALKVVSVRMRRLRKFASAQIGRMKA